MTSPNPTMQQTPPAGYVNQPPMQTQQPAKSGSKLGCILFSCFALIVLLVGGAAAFYFLVFLPGQTTAYVDTVKTDYSTVQASVENVKGKVNVSSTPIDATDKEYKNFDKKTLNKFRQDTLKGFTDELFTEEVLGIDSEGNVLAGDSTTPDSLTALQELKQKATTAKNNLPASTPAVRDLGDELDSYYTFASEFSDNGSSFIKFIVDLAPILQELQSITAPESFTIQSVQSLEDLDTLIAEYKTKATEVTELKNQLTSLTSNQKVTEIKTIYSDYLDLYINYLNDYSAKLEQAKSGILAQDQAVIDQTNTEIETLRTEFMTNLNSIGQRMETSSNSWKTYFRDSISKLEASEVRINNLISGLS